MYERRCDVSVAVLDGFIYAMGGFDGRERLSSAERYDPSANQWTLTAPMHVQRSDASAVSLQGRVYICGGYTGTECLFSAESFNPESNQWTLIAAMNSCRTGVGVIAYGHLVYAGSCQWNGCFPQRSELLCSVRIAKHGTRRRRPDTRVL
ncbi:hypothetical protein G5714_019307 [Onychostoma macrolepis]|uniref:Kelch-like protein 18 n=1 Tax=Onychostoma macrolepis TaxID=369639 RepID=A0A7J6BWQ2_9TELE|nr:hypothetical protein G5714_019307 [Onychostoma macrolepis]